MLSVIKYKIHWFVFSGVLVVISIALLLSWGLRLGIDFTGGSLLEINVQGARLEHDDFMSVFQEHNIDSLVIQETSSGVLLRFQEISEAKHQGIITGLKEKAKEGTIEEIRFESIGPSIGEELKQKSIQAIIVVLVAIVIYIAWAFRKVSRPVASWKYGLTSLIVLFHDVMVVVGLFVVLGRFFSLEVNAPFIAALLTVLGYSVNDTIVIFDRIRENIFEGGRSYEETIDKSVNDTLSRSVNTSLTTLLVLISVYLFGGESVKSFVLALIAGIIAGTYSSIFLASPLLAVWHRIKIGRY